LAFGSLFDGCYLGAIFEGQRCVSGLETKDEKMLACGVWKMILWLFGGLLGREGIDGFSRA